MQAVLLVLHIFIAIGLVGLILLQKSEGGALGMGGGPGGLMSGRGVGNVLTRGTSALGAAFFITSLALTVLAAVQNDRRTTIEQQLDADEDGRFAPALAPLEEEAAPPAEEAAVEPEEDAEAEPEPVLVPTDD